jgi:hypothetical protein
MMMSTNSQQIKGLPSQVFKLKAELSFLFFPGTFTFYICSVHAENRRAELNPIQ